MDGLRYLLDTNILVTDNVDEFARVAGLRLENWLVSPTAAPE